MKLSLSLLGLTFTIAGYTDVARSQWVLDGVGLCTEPSAQVAPTIVPDGAGGAIVAWEDWRGGGADIYAQRVSASGVALWMPDGVALCTATGQQLYPAIASDGAGGAIVTWQDQRGGTPSAEIFAQRVDPGGAPKWATDGVKVCTAVDHQFYPAIVSDGFGGAIVTWRDFRSGDYDPYAQRLSEAGDRLWGADGIALCIDPNIQVNPVAVPDGTGGAIVAWEDHRSGYPYSDIYAQRLNPIGDPKWSVNGVAICAAAQTQYLAVIAPDDAGGAIVAWTDGRSGGSSDIYAQRVNDVGEPQWMLDGVSVCAAGLNQDDVKIVPDGAGGAIMTWRDGRSGPGFDDKDIYAQRMDASGAPQWMLDGVALCTAAGVQQRAVLAADGAGGAFVAWTDERSSPFPDSDVYVQRVNGAGVPQWTPDGIALCTAAYGQHNPQVSFGGAGGAIVTWEDYRSGIDVYAQKVLPDGGVPTSIGEVPSPSFFAISPNFPNPFSVVTTIDVSIAAPGTVAIEVFDVAGRRVRAIDLGRMDAGARRMTFDGRDGAGRLLPNGVYLYRVRVNGVSVTRKMVIAR